jgi:hypothetical protein
MQSSEVRVALITYFLTYSMERSLSGEANRFSASQETPRILWNTKVQSRIHKWPPPVPNLSHLDPVRAPTPHLGRTKVSVQVLVLLCERFVKGCVVTVRAVSTLPTPNLEDYLLSAVRDSLFNIFAATLHTGGRSSTRNLRTPHAVGTGTHLSRTVALIWFSLLKPTGYLMQHQV